MPYSKMEALHKIFACDFVLAIYTLSSKDLSDDADNIINKGTTFTAEKLLNCSSIGNWIHEN